MCWLMPTNFLILISVILTQQAHNYSGFKAYCQSKNLMVNILFTHKLAKELQGTGVNVNALHPGGVYMNVVHNVNFNLFWYVEKLERKRNVCVSTPMHVCVCALCICTAGKFHQEKIFNNFTTCSHWQIFLLNIA